MSDPGPPPEIPPDLQQYNSYAIDPQYQIKFTIVWTSILAVTVLYLLPKAFRQRRQWYGGAAGVLEGNNWRRVQSYPSHNDTPPSQSMPPTESNPCTVCARKRSISNTRPSSQSTASTGLHRIFPAIRSASYWTPPFFGGFQLGQLLLVAAYYTTAILCTLLHVPLSTNSNRAGFLAIAQLPPLFLLSAKASPINLFLPTHFSYTKLNFLHRWAARGILLCVIIHGSLWVADHRRWNIPILGQEKETSGIAAFGTLCIIGLASLRIVREKAWVVFHWVHFLGFPAFFVTICYHTPYAYPWIIVPIVIYSLDLFIRSTRARLKDAFLIRVDDQMTLIHIPNCDSGFRGGQHLRLRVFFDGTGLYEAHPFSVMSAPSSVSCVREADVAQYWKPQKLAMNHDPEQSRSEESGYSNREEAGYYPAGIILGVRSAGNWTVALNAFSKTQEDRIRAADPSGSGDTVSSSTLTSSPVPIPIPVQVMFDGPYGGCELELGEYDRVLLLAGGGGATFALGVLDEIVGTCINAREKGSVVTKTRVINFVWCMRSFTSIRWFAPILSAIVRAGRGVVQLRVVVYVTCLCSPEDVSGIPGLEVRVGSRPDISRLLREIMGLDSESEKVDVDECCRCGCIPGELKPSGEGVEGEKQKEKQIDMEKGGGEPGRRWTGKVAVCASGPMSMTRDAANAVARCAGRSGVEVGLHTEVFAI